MSFIEHEPCDICGKRPWTKIVSGKFICIDCPVPILGFPTLRETVFNKFIGNVPKREIDEIKRHRMIPTPRADGGNYSGRFGDDGKIHEAPLKTM